MTVFFVLLGCQSDKSDNWRREQASTQENRGGLRYFPGIGWQYLPSGANANILTNNNSQLLEYTREAMKEERFGEAMFAARYFIKRTPTANDVPEMRRVVAEVYEGRGFDEYAFKQYQQLLDAHPDYDKTDEVFDRMHNIATLYLNGKSFRWKIPWQDTIYLSLIHI